jgi:DNA-binding IclR family transcriptional regulator
MGTVNKTLKLLSYLTTRTPEMGLSEFMRASGYDKASTYRRLSELVECGFLEQDPHSRAYHLGGAISRLALVREETFPARKSALLALETLAARVGETVHVSVRQGSEGLNTLAHIDDQSHGNRVYIEPADILPFNATASGMAVLAYSDPGFVEAVLARGLQGTTPDTITDAATLNAALERTRAQGYARSWGGYEADVHGLALPLFDGQRTASGAVAIAAPAARLPDERIPDLLAALYDTAVEITTAWSGEYGLEAPRV